MSKVKTGDNKPHPRMEMQAMLDRQEHERNQTKKAQAKPVGPQQRGDNKPHPRMEMQAMLGSSRTRAKPSKKSTSKTCRASAEG